MTESGNRLTPEQEARYMRAVNRLATAEPIVLELQAPLALLIVADLQLALRHPAQPSRLAGIVEFFTRSLIAQLCDREPDLRTVLELGWDPSYDQAVLRE